MTRPLATLILLCVALFAAIFILTLVVLVPGAGGRWPLDYQAGGYTPADVALYLEMLSDGARQVYLGPMRWLDSAFPLGLAGLLGVLCWSVTRDIHTWARMVLLVPMGGYTIMDLAENALIADLLLNGVNAEFPETAIRASEFTITKFVLLTVAAVLIFGIWLHRKFSTQH